MSKSALKIGFVLDDSLDKTDGVQQYVLTLGKWLESVGHEVHYLVGQSNRKDIKRVHSLSRNIRVRFNKNRMSIPLHASRRGIRGLLEKEQFDILHVQMPYSPQLGARVVQAAPAKTAVIGTFHIVPYSPAQSVASRMLAFSQSKSLKRFDFVLSVSPAAKKFAREVFGLNSGFLPNVIEYKKFLIGKPINKYHDGAVNIVFLGRLVKRKGAKHLLKALSLLPELPTQPWRVLFCGSGPQRRKLERLVRRNKLGERVEFCGYIPEEQKPDYLATADIAIFPSLGGESFGIVLLEAMASKSGVVVGGDNDGYRSVLGRWKHCLVDPRDSIALASRLYGFIASKELRDRIHNYQQQAVKKYDVELVGPMVVKVYRSTIAKRSKSKDN